MAAVPADVFFATATEIHARWAAREFSAVELVRAFSDRLERVGPRYNALALSLREDARRRAEDIDKEGKRGRLRTPLQAVPCGVKDLVSIADHPTTWGAQPYAGQVFDEDAEVVRRLRKAKALVVGKLAMVELAGGPSYRYAAASLQGPGLNPWDAKRWAGGSSSGSGAAVAAGLMPYAIGSETSGSILTPAAFCGVTGLRPTYGLVSRYGCMPLSWTMDKIGVVARSAEDCAHVLSVMAGGDERDAGASGKGFRFAPELARPAREVRAGFAPVDFSDHAAAPLRPILSDALKIFSEIGLTFKETEMPAFPYAAMAQTIISAEGSSVFAELIESGRVEQLADARQIAGLKAGLEIPARDYLHAMRARTLLQAAWEAWMADLDVLIAPTRLDVAPLISEPLDRTSSTATSTAERPGLRYHIAGGNLAGWPALALPCGLAGGLPVSISLVGRPYSENLLLTLGMEFQKRTQFHRLQPAMQD
jgi:aspartyl-tRNA(Asn)/glutamyl-tRNA(Gln) amidotransferase subunit A